MSENPDDFWNQSSSSVPNFFDDDDESSFPAEAFPAIPQTEQLPIQAIISNKALITLLDDVNSTLAYVVIPPEETIKRMFLGLKMELGIYRTLDDKLALLDFAVDIGDGFLITKVLCFLRSTLKRNIFLMQLIGRGVACKHYVDLLMKEQNPGDLADFYMATGMISGLKNIYHLINNEYGSATVLQKKLASFNFDHGQNLTADDKAQLHDNITLIDWLLKYNLNCKTLVDLLISLCKTEWEKGHNDELLLSLKSQFRMDEYQYEWIILNVLCKMNLWNKIENTFVKSGWMIKKKTLKTQIRPDVFVFALARHNPPAVILEQYLPLMGDAEKSLWLAEKHQIHNYIVTYFIEQKDKIALLKHMENLKVGDQAMEKIHVAINNPDIRWKN